MLFKPREIVFLIDIIFPLTSTDTTSYTSIVHLVCSLCSFEEEVAFVLFCAAKNPLQKRQKNKQKKRVAKRKSNVIVNSLLRLFPKCPKLFTLVLDMC